MASVKPYTLKDAQRFVKDAIARTKTTHKIWDQLETIYATGDIAPIAAGTAGTLIDDVYGVGTLDRVNLALPNLNIIIASISERVPQFVVEPLAVDGENDELEADAASAGEDLIKYFWKRTNSGETLKYCTKDLVVVGCAFAKIGWSYSEASIERDILGVVADQVTAEEEGQPVEDIPLTEMVVLEDEPFVEYVFPTDVFVSEDAKDLTSARWVAQRVRKPVDELRSELNIPETVMLTIEPLSDSVGKRTTTDYARYGAFSVATVYEFYDQRTGMLMIFQESSEKALYSGPIPYSRKKAPIVMMRNYQKNARDFYGFGDMLNIATLQLMFNETFTLMMDNMRRSGTFLIVDDSVVSNETREALENPRNGKIVPITLGKNKNINDWVMQFRTPELSPDLYRASGDLQEFAANTIGLSDFQRGLNGASRMSGTAAAAVEGHSSLRAADKQASIAKFISTIGEWILLLASEFMTETVAVKISGAPGRTVREITPDHIYGDFLVSVDAGSVTAINPATRNIRAIERANQLVPVLAANGYDIDPLMRSIVRDMDLDPDVILKKIQPASPPDAGMGSPAGMPAGLPAGGGLPQDMVGGLAADAAVAGGIVG